MPGRQPKFDDAWSTPSSLKCRSEGLAEPAERSPGYQTIGVLNLSRWECKYHKVFIPKYGKNPLYIGSCDGTSARCLVDRSADASIVEEGHLIPDDVHMMLSSPPKCAVAQVVGFMRGNSAIQTVRTFGEQKRDFVGQHFLGSRRTS